IPDYGVEPILLTDSHVESIHEMGGSFLGSSRGNQNIQKMADTLERLKIDCLFTVGGDGTFRGANELYLEIKKRERKISVIGIPKTIDNDIMYIDKTFGFETAFSQAVNAIRSGVIEAKGYPKGVALIKLMGRHSGYVTAHAALALREI
ncbi:MAG: 6-phosphofructokinase, partial [Oligoflexia bacterium]|nr:6-phosphofructokinase [Oligoflexia bacterium]